MKKIFTLLTAAATLTANSQTTSVIPELVFSNPSVVTGNAGDDNTVYKFPSVNATHDALVKIKGRSNTSVHLTSIDLTTTGFDKSFQPRINYTGNISSGSSHWMEFEITFIDKNTSAPANINSFYATTVDIDGDNQNLREWDAFYMPVSYTLEANTVLQTGNYYDGISMPGKSFMGPVTNYDNIDTTATELMATVKYVNTSQIRIRMGVNVTGNNPGSPNRMYSVYFKNFSFNNPVTLPVKLNNFQGSKNKNNVMLQWNVGMNEANSNFEVERSADGKNFETAAMVMASEKTGNEIYSYSEINESAKVYYRLRMTDKANTVSYSKILVFNSSAAVSKSLSIIGNVVNDKLTFSFESAAGSKADIRIADMNGKNIAQQSLNVNKGNNMASISLPGGLNSGMYIATLSVDNVNSSAKFVKQ